MKNPLNIVRQFSTREQQAMLILILTVNLYLYENIYFGWNARPMSPAEGVCDFFVWIGMLLSFLWKPMSNDTTIYKIYPDDPSQK